MEMTLPDSSVVLNLEKLANKYAHLVPFRIKVVNGFMAENAKDPTFGVDEIYSVHLVKETKVMTVTSAGGNYSIPLNSTAKFGLIYDEENESRHFDTVDEVVNAKPRPKVVAVKSKYVSPDDRLHLEKNEILIVRDVTRTKLGKNKSGMIVYSCLSQREFVLQKSQDIQFTTSPRHTQLYLTDLLEHGSNILPCSARTYSSKVSSLASSSVITLQSEQNSVSVLVSLFRDNPTSKSKKNTVFFDIPTRININVNILQTNKSDSIYYEMMNESKNLLHNYSLAEVYTCVDARSDEDYMTQAQLLAEVRKEREKKTLAKYAPGHYETIILGEKTDGGREESKTALMSPTTHKTQAVPDKLLQTVNSPPHPVPAIKQKPERGCPSPDHYGPLPPSLPVKQLPPRSMSPVLASHERKKRPLPPVPPKSNDIDYEDMTSFSSPRTPPIESNHRKESPRITGSVSKPASLAPSSPLQHAQRSQIKKPKEGGHLYEEFTGSDASALSKQMKGMQKKLAKLGQQVEELTKRQLHFEAEIAALRSENASSPRTKTPTISKGMSPDEVQRVLEDVGLTQYKEAFAKECIDGELFAILDDETLANEMGVTSKIHRFKILKLISKEET